MLLLRKKEKTGRPKRDSILETLIILHCRRILKSMKEPVKNNDCGGSAHLDL